MNLTVNVVDGRVLIMYWLGDEVDGSSPSHTHPSTELLLRHHHLEHHRVRRRTQTPADIFAFDLCSVSSEGPLQGREGGRRVNEERTNGIEGDEGRRG